MQGKIRIRINVYCVNTDGSVTLQSGVPVEIKRDLYSPYYGEDKEIPDWNDGLTMFSGTSDENGLVYIGQLYTYVKNTNDAQYDTVYLGNGSSNDFDHVVFQRVDNNKGGIRFSIAPAENSGYTLVAGSNGSAVKCTSNSNGGPMTRQDKAFSVDDFVFHDGLGDGDGQSDNNGGAYLVFNMYVKGEAQPTTATATIELNSYLWDHNAYTGVYGSGQTDSPVGGLTYDIVYYDYDNAATQRVLRTGGVTVDDTGKKTIILSAEELQTLEAFWKTLPEDHHLALDISPSTHPASDGKTYAWDWQTVDGTGSAGVIGIRTMNIPDENGGWKLAKEGRSESVTSGRYTYSPNPNHTPWLNQDLLTNGFQIQWNCYVTPSMTVTFDVDEGTGAFAAQQFKPITSVPDDQQNDLAKNPGDPTAPEGRVFVGWYKVESDGSLESTPWNFAGRIVTETMTLKAVYADRKYTVKFEVPGDAGTPASIQENQYIIGNTPIWSGEDPAKDGYVFIGWKETAIRIRFTPSMIHIL